MRRLVVVVGLLLSVATAGSSPGWSVVADFSAETCLGLAATITGTEGDDDLTGTADMDVIVGLGGTDRIDGGPGDDVICGGDNPLVEEGPLDDDLPNTTQLVPEVIYGGEGNDRIDAGPGHDRVDAGPGNDWVSIGTSQFWPSRDLLAGEGVSGGPGDDTLRADGGRGARMSGDRGRDVLLGGAYEDQLGGGDGPDVLRGFGGNDRLEGRSGPDALIGGNGDDRLYGGDDADQNRGGPGADLLDGGPGLDENFGGPGPFWHDRCISPGTGPDAHSCG